MDVIERKQQSIFRAAKKKVGVFLAQNSPFVTIPPRQVKSETQCGNFALKRHQVICLNQTAEASYLLHIKFKYAFAQNKDCRFLPPSLTLKVHSEGI